jgi:hypothetical protein
LCCLQLNLLATVEFRESEDSPCLLFELKVVIQGALGPDQARATRTVPPHHAAAEHAECQCKAKAAWPQPTAEVRSWEAVRLARRATPEREPWSLDSTVHLVGRVFEVMGIVLVDKHAGMRGRSPSYGRTHRRGCH